MTIFFSHGSQFLVTEYLRQTIRSELNCRGYISNNDKKVGPLQLSMFS
jgi:aromatic ring-cleaving dioxygenase